MRVGGEEERRQHGINEEEDGGREGTQGKTEGKTEIGGREEDTEEDEG